MACETCRTPKTTQHCRLCEAGLCKRCAMNPPAGAFRYLKDVPAELTHPVYCQSCFTETVEPALTDYESTLEAAREVFVFFTTQKAHIPLLSKSHERVSVDSEEDRDALILKLAYLAALEGHNALIECDVRSEKVRNEGYQHSVWRGSAIPATVDASRLDRDH